jgi:tetratricopeptide (TPR) repeat protein
MNFDPNNPVVQLCAQGMQIEAEGNTTEAHKLFTKAWEASTNNFERFTAAHYLARNQPTPEQNLYWNLEALRYAKLTDNTEAQGHLPSLHLNIGKSYENMGQLTEATKHYQLAYTYSHYLPAGGYGNMLRSGISAALQRVGITIFKNADLDTLINNWCQQKNLQALALVLPAYISNLGTETDINKLISALSYLAATPCLQAEEQTVVEQLIKELATQQPQII